MNPLYLISKLQKKARLSSVKGSSIHSSSKVEAGSEIYDSNFGRHSFCGYNCHIVKCDIGAFCSIANHVIIGGGEHPVEWVSTSPVFYEGRDSVKAKFSNHTRPPIKRTVIGNDVWIGSRVIVRQGVNIGHGAVVGMGSIVTRDVPAYSIVAGSPARVLRYRFDDAIVAGLLDSKWWEFSDQQLLKYAPFFTEPERFLEQLAR